MTTPISKYLSDPKYSDATVTIVDADGEKHCYRIHRIVFARASKYFETLFDSGMKDSTNVELKGVSPNTFGLFVTWVYTTFFNEMKGIGAVCTTGLPSRKVFEESFIFCSPAFSKYAWPKDIDDRQKFEIALTYNIDFFTRECLIASYKEAIQLAKEIDTVRTLVNVINLLSDEMGIYMLLIWVVLHPEKPIDVAGLIASGKIYPEAAMHISPKCRLSNYAAIPSLAPLFAACAQTTIRKRSPRYNLRIVFPTVKTVEECGAKEILEQETQVRVKPRECKMCTSTDIYTNVKCIACLRTTGAKDKCQWCSNTDEEGNMETCDKCKIVWCRQCRPRHDRRCC